MNILIKRGDHLVLRSHKGNKSMHSKLSNYVNDIRRFKCKGDTLLVTYDYQIHLGNSIDNVALTLKNNQGILQQIVTELTGLDTVDNKYTIITPDGNLSGTSTEVVIITSPASELDFLREESKQHKIYIDKCIPDILLLNKLSSNKSKLIFSTYGNILRISIFEGNFIKGFLEIDSELYNYNEFRKELERVLMYLKIHSKNTARLAPIVVATGTEMNQFKPYIQTTIFEVSKFNKRKTNPMIKKFSTNLLHSLATANGRR